MTARHNRPSQADRQVMSPGSWPCPPPAKCGSSQRLFSNPISWRMVDAWLPADQPCPPENESKASRWASSEVRPPSLPTIDTGTKPGTNGGRPSATAHNLTRTGAGDLQPHSQRTGYFGMPRKRPNLFPLFAIVALTWPQELRSDWNFEGWWLGAELNRRHKDFQSSALPTELPSRPLRAANSTHQPPVWQGGFRTVLGSAGHTVSPLVLNSRKAR